MVVLESVDSLEVAGVAVSASALSDKKSRVIRDLWPDLQLFTSPLYLVYHI